MIKKFNSYNESISSINDDYGDSFIRDCFVIIEDLTGEDIVITPMFTDGNNTFHMLNDNNTDVYKSYSMEFSFNALKKLDHSIDDEDEEDEYDEDNENEEDEETDAIVNYDDFSTFIKEVDKIKAKLKSYGFIFFKTAVISTSASDITFNMNCYYSKKKYHISNEVKTARKSMIEFTKFMQKYLNNDYRTQNGIYLNRRNCYERLDNGRADYSKPLLNIYTVDIIMSQYDQNMSDRDFSEIYDEILQKLETLKDISIEQFYNPKTGVYKVTNEKVLSGYHGSRDSKPYIVIYLPDGYFDLYY